MIYLKLFLTFFEVGLMSFGGGFGMMALIREKMLEFGWLTEEELLNMVAVAESTPGPIAVNIATFVGSSQAGVLGALVSTLGIVLPSFIIILLIASLIKNFLKYKAVNAFLGGVRPTITGLILATAVTMSLSALLNIVTVYGEVSFDIQSTVIFAVLLAVGAVYGRIKKCRPSPIVMILISAGLGMIIYSV